MTFTDIQSNQECSDWTVNSQSGQNYYVGVIPISTSRVTPSCLFFLKSLFHGQVDWQVYEVICIFVSLCEAFEKTSYPTRKLELHSSKEEHHSPKLLVIDHVKIYLKKQFF